MVHQGAIVRVFLRRLTKKNLHCKGQLARATFRVAHLKCEWGCCQRRGMFHGMASQSPMSWFSVLETTSGPVWMPKAWRIWARRCASCKHTAQQKVNECFSLTWCRRQTSTGIFCRAGELFCFCDGRIASGLFLF